MHDDATVVSAHRPHLAATWSSRGHDPNPGAIGDRPAHRVPGRVDPQGPRLGAAAQQARPSSQVVWIHRTCRTASQYGPKRMRRVVQLAGRNVELSAADEWRWEAVDALFAGCADSSQIPRRPPAIRSATADAPRSPSDAVVHRDRRLARRRRRGLPERGRCCRTDVTATTSSSVGRRTVHRRPIRHSRPGPGSRVRSGDGVPPQRSTRAGRRPRRARPARAARSIDPLRRSRRRRPRGHRRREIDAGVRGIPTRMVGAHRRPHVRRRSTTETYSRGDSASASTSPAIWCPASDHERHRASRDGDPERRARNRLQLPLEHDEAPGAGRVAAVVLVEHAAGAGHLERIEPGPSLLKSLLPSFPLAPDRSRMRELFPSAAALSRLPAWRLYHDADPPRRLDVAGTLLASIMQTLELDAVGRDRRAISSCRECRRDVTRRARGRRSTPTPAA